jgi:hypothetical protein
MNSNVLNAYGGYAVNHKPVVCNTKLTNSNLLTMVMYDLSVILIYSNLSLWLLTVNSCIKVRLDSQAYKSLVVVKRPFFPRVVNPRYRIRGTNV